MCLARQSTVAHLSRALSQGSRRASRRCERLGALTFLLVTNVTEAQMEVYLDAFHDEYMRTVERYVSPEHRGGFYGTRFSRLDRGVRLDPTRGRSVRFGGSTGSRGSSVVSSRVRRAPIAEGSTSNRGVADRPDAVVTIVDLAADEPLRKEKGHLAHD
jgi:hypothetical protein